MSKGDPTPGGHSFAPPRAAEGQEVDRFTHKNPAYAWVTYTCHHRISRTSEPVPRDFDLESLRGARCSGCGAEPQEIGIFDEDGNPLEDAA